MSFNVCVCSSKCADLNVDLFDCRHVLVCICRQRWFTISQIVEEQLHIITDIHYAAVCCYAVWYLFWGMSSPIPSSCIIYFKVFPILCMYATMPARWMS